jgi:hypothetical protein
MQGIVRYRTTVSPEPTMPRRIIPLLAAALLAACSTEPPDNPGNACAIFSEYRGWWEAVRNSEERWGVPAEVQLAILHQESSFEQEARPPHRKLLFVIPTPLRQSSSMGYAQATRATWDWYKKEAGRPFASRESFRDSADFVGWYARKSRRLSGIALDDAYNQYLAYHEGQGGFNNGTHRRDRELLRSAERVASRAATYRAQLEGCRRRLDRTFLFF